MHKQIMRICYKGIDESKDQSYFLHAIDKEVL